ncbi:MFS transporter, SHS family, lactate transporter [Exophiala aquamarina CBS 119918]|uniref:MFS transporter, SHS family, lactate transporter n=1 Tax=Exophiala aquamarina CBS 119918 TaxID=1182545 RepID=A0A072Q4I7_9EURO|nr:MFS transporter, SHS family, lactate transporter [Exophiala aquamarina CBS 119918]KEF62795.1 MFS transporter, SHS family, lactate transporter [Exophiala aquamarina CBS 119918]
MPFPSKKRKAANQTYNDSDVDVDVLTKRGKASSGAAFKPASEPLFDSDGNRYWEISKARRVTLSDFKGKQMVNVREYYQKDDEWLPGKKGISMTVEQYSALINIMPQIESALKQKGETIPRPNYGQQAAGGDQDDQGDDDDQIEDKKANIEATSDEEE